MTPGELVRIEAMLTARIGLDPAAVASSLIPRAVRLRMIELGLGHLRDYESLLRGSEAELQALIEEVVVPESWFFRDKLPFRYLRDHARTLCIGNPARSPLRVLSMPCAGGEEPYSIAITLLECGLSRQRFQVDALDISQRRLDLARRGVFSRNAFRDNDQEFRARYFKDHPQGYELDPSIRASVRYLQGSVLDPTLLIGEARYDVIFCRNLLIYLDSPSRASVMATLDRLLAAEGLLIVGHADRIDLTSTKPGFISAREPGAFAFRRKVASAPPAPSDQVRKVAVRKSEDSSHQRHPQVATEFKGQNLGQNLSQVQEQPKLPSESEGKDRDSLLDEASKLANGGRHDEALAVCEQLVRLRGPNSAAYYLMGVINQAAGKAQRAEECFHKSVYLDPGHDEALLALALIAERRGDSAAAAGFRRRAKRAELKARKGAP
jgi:chemotaxis protein methyltransferase WspC